MPDVVTIAGSPSAPSRSGAVLEHVRAELERGGLSTASITVRDLPAVDLIHGRYDSPAIAHAFGLIHDARAVVVATPIYKAAYSGVLKTFLDLLPSNALAGKTVLPIATGGSMAHFLALDYALRPVLVALGAHQILNGVYIVDSHVQHAATGGIQLDPAIAERLDGALRLLTEHVEHVH